MNSQEEMITTVNVKRGVLIPLRALPDPPGAELRVIAEHVGRVQDLVEDGDTAAPLIGPLGIAREPIILGGQAPSGTLIGLFFQRRLRSFSLTSR